ncbi:hypothetical protein, partial [Escherichia coli]|uniref:hypothetical protein n=1 Tax=Escherichia coli TaxID=562 RepID=UPI001BAE6FC3
MGKALVLPPFLALLSLCLVQQGQIPLTNTPLGVRRYRDLLHGVPPNLKILSCHCAILSRNDMTRGVSCRDTMSLNLV